MKKIKQALSIGLLLFLATTTFAQLDKAYFKKLNNQRVESTNAIDWRQIGPGMAGYCEEFWCHPTDANVMFMSPDMYNSYGTWDNGKSWHTIKDCDGSGVDMRRIQSITFSHQDPNFGFAIDVRGHLYNTTNQGHSWTRDESFIGKGRYSEMVVDPTNDNIWYIGAGDFWNVKANHRSKNKPEGNVYKYASYGHILKSTDKGSTWTKINKGLPKTLDVGKIIIDPSSPKNVIMATNTGVYKSTDSGKSWKQSSNGLPNNLPRDMTSFYDKKTKEFILYLVEHTIFEPKGNTTVSKGGIFKSTDRGATWQNISGNLAVDLSQITSYNSRNKYWKSVAYWLGMKDKVARKQFKQLPKSVLSVFHRIRVNPTNKNEIYLSHNVKHDKAFIPGDIWKSNDGGKTWIATARTGKYWLKGKDNAYWKSRNNPIGMNTKYAHLHHEQEKREEAFGNRFLEINSKGELFACLEQQVMRTNNHGKSWEQVDDYETKPGSKHWVGRGASNLPGRFILTETGIKSRYLLCSGEHGLWQTASLDDFADTKTVAVEQIEGQLNHKGATSIASVAVHPKDPNIIYTLQFRQDHRGFFRRSTDGGKTWENLSEPLHSKENMSMKHIFQYSLTIDKNNPNNIYFCVIYNPIGEVSGQKMHPKDFNRYGVLKSADGGKTWTEANGGLPGECSVRRLAIHPQNTSTLYAALNKLRDGALGGLYKTTNGAKTWKEVEIPSEIKSVNNVSINKKTKDIFISCGSPSGNAKEGGVWRSSDNGRSWKKIFEMPYVWQTESSPIDPKMLTVVVAAQKETRKKKVFNPGAYLSKDGGKTWLKVNRNLGQPNTITDFRPDPHTKGIYWLALKGSGWAIGYNRGFKKGWSEIAFKKK